MSNESKRAEGVAQEIGGKVKKAVGGLIGNEQMQAEGRAQELGGEARRSRAREEKAAARVQGKVEEVTGAIKDPHRGRHRQRADAGRGAGPRARR